MADGGSMRPARRFLAFCSLSRSNGRSLRSRWYKFLASTRVKMSIVFCDTGRATKGESQERNDGGTETKKKKRTAHSRMSSSQTVSDESVWTNWSHRSTEMAT